jgi:hypothetical protein
MTPTTAREFAERLLDGCTLAYDGTLPFIRRRLDEAAALIEADREAIRREALEPFVALAAELESKRSHSHTSSYSSSGIRQNDCYARTAAAIRSLLPPAEKAGPT